MRTLSSNPAVKSDASPALRAYTRAPYRERYAFK